MDLGALPLLSLAGLYLMLLRPWRPRRLWSHRAPSVDLFFVLVVSSGLSALYWPAPFERVAIALVEQTELPATVRDVDARIAAVESLPERLWADIKARLGFGDEAPPAPVPAHAADRTGSDSAQPVGPLEAALLPGVVGLCEGLLRTTVYLVSLLAIIIAQLLRGLAGLRRRLAQRARPLGALEARVASLEAQIAAVGDTPEGVAAGHPPVS